jgi:O-antigen ligase
MGGNHEGAWRGLFGHKNGFGPFLVIHMLLTLFGRRYLRLPLILALIFAAVDGVALAFAQSSTSIVAAVAGLAAGLVFLPIRHNALRFLWRMGAIAVLLAAVSFLVLDLDKVFELLGKDSSLAGRSQMWAQVYDMTFRSTLGTGYGTSGGSQVSIEIQKLVKRQDMVGVQSGYLNMALELGWIAVGLFVIWLVSSIGTTLMAVNRSSAQPLFVSLAVQHLIGSYSESYGCLFPSWSLAVLVTALVAMRVHSPVRWLPSRRGPRVSVPAAA